MDLLRSAIEGEHRVLVFSQFTSMLELMKERLREEEIRFYEITGATPKKERLRLVTDFNGGDTPEDLRYILRQGKFLRTPCAKYAEKTD